VRSPPTEKGTNFTIMRGGAVGTAGAPAGRARRGAPTPPPFRPKGSPTPPPNPFLRLTSTCLPNITNQIKTNPPQYPPCALKTTISRQPPLAVSRCSYFALSLPSVSSVPPC